MGCYPHFNLTMRSSRGFASTAPDLWDCSLRPIQTRFRFGSASKTLNLARHGKSPDHYAKGTPSLWRAPRSTLIGSIANNKLESPILQSAKALSRNDAPSDNNPSFKSAISPRSPEREARHRAPTACRHVVSGSRTSPERGSSHLSLALLVRYRSLVST
jgi:hypothetical protein